MSRLLDQLALNQQRLVDVVGEAFVAEKCQWPVFDYVEGALDYEGIDAWETLESFPRTGLWDYSAVWFVGGNSRAKPPPELEVMLTLVGIRHSGALADFEPPLIPTFFALLDYLVERRRAGPLSPRKPRDLTVNGSDVLAVLGDRGHRVDLGPPRLLYAMMEREPATFGGSGSVPSDARLWTKHVVRDVFDYEGITSIDDYVVRLERLTAMPQPAAVPAAPSPLGLVANLDYLNTVWRLRHKGAPLFVVASAERAAKLAFPAQTPEEFDSRVSGLSEILRRLDIPRVNGTSKPKKARDRPLGVFENHVLTLVDPSSEGRVRQAIATLESVIFIRDAGQHSPAGERAVAALTDLGIGYPPGNWSQAWETVSAQTVEALSALREELES
jgi:hypothetical protein